MTSFSSTPVALAYFLLVAMGVVALLTVGGFVSEAVVQRRAVPAVLAALAVPGLWEYRRRG